MIWFARHLIPAYSVQARDDLDLVDGLHLRITPSRALGLPITPFLVYPMSTRPLRQQGEFIDMGDGNRRVSLPAIAERDYVAVAADASARGRKDWISAMHIDGLRIAAKRSQAPLMVAGPRLDQLRVSSQVGAVVFHGVRPTDLEKMVMSDSPYPRLGLPVDGDLPWYAGGDGSGAGKDRVLLSAPKRLSPVDVPDGTLQQIQPDDEWKRLRADAVEMDALLAAMLGRNAIAPHEALREQQGFDDNGVPQSVSSEVLGDVLLRATDPGMARYLGLAGTFENRGRPEILPALGAVALFAIPRPVRKQLERNGSGPPSEDAGEVVIQRFMKLIPGLAQVIEVARKHDMWVGPISTVAASPPPPDLPVVPSVFPQQGRWTSNDAGGQFAQGFVIRRPPVAPLVALARLEGKWIPLNDPGPSGRRRIRLVGTRVDPAPTDGQAAEIQGIVFHQPVPAALLPRYRFSIGDLFGRYGPPAECDPDAPPRPPPPMPVPQTSVRRAAALPAAGNVSPGDLHLCLSVPRPDDLALGALPIVNVAIDLAGSPHSQPVGAQSDLRLSYPLPTLSPQAHLDVMLRIRFRDEAGVESEPYEELLRIADARAPKAIPFSYGLIWASRPGPAKESEIALTWPAPAGQQHRIYIADAAGLSLAGKTRAHVADAGVKRALQGQIAGPAARKVFRLLSEKPVLAGDDGNAEFRGLLPRALRTVQFVRIVPISSGGVEADFDSCGLVPVAVPDDRRPPPPRLHMSSAADGTPTLVVEATGFNLDLLRQAEPELFAGEAGALAPEFRLRRASGVVPDPLFAREIGRGKLIPETRDGVVTLSASSPDTASPAPYVRYTYWAEVRMPAERRVVVNEVAVAGGVTGVSTIQMNHHPAQWSAVSAPLTVLNAPAGPPPAISEKAVKLTFIDPQVGAGIDVTVRELPPTSPAGPWHLRIWLAWNGGPLTQVAEDLEIGAAVMSWSEPGPPGTTTGKMGVALVDPVGRQGPIQVFDA
jgi:hypothetical protein